MTSLFKQVPFLLTSSTVLPDGVTASTQAALADNTRVATNAYVDAAVAVENSRATTAENLLAPKASPTFSGTVTLNTGAGTLQTTSGNLTINAGGGNSVLIGFNGSTQWAVSSANNVRTAANFSIGWSSSNNAASAGADTALSRTAAGVIAFGNGAQGSVTGNLRYNRINTSGADHSGQATITAGNTTIAVTFAANYTTTTQPIVVVTPTSDPLALGVPVGVWVTYGGSAGAWTGFTINIQSTLAGNVTFNYIVVGAS